MLPIELGNGRWETATYNERQQVEMIGLGGTNTTQDLLKLEFRYGAWNGSTLDESQNNGSMAEQKITVPAAGTNPTFTAIQKYTYDSLNRINDATETVSSTQTWKQTFSYDRYGNRRFNTSGSNTTTIPGGCSAAVCNPDINTSDNRLSASQGYEYDENGALVEDALGQRFGYDAESHQKEFFSASNSGSTPDATYHYDGEGRRVKKIVGSEVTIFVYNAAGLLVEEYSTTIASAQDAQVSYLTTDHLGSPRIITDGNGAVTNRKDFTAFGETVTSSQRVGGSNGNGYDDPQAVIRQDYTGYQKDGESGLEFAQARYYNTAHGRFTSADPLTASATIRNPQTLNRYSYSLNSPFKFVDPLGLTSQLSGAGSCPPQCEEGQVVTTDDGITGVMSTSLGQGLLATVTVSVSQQGDSIIPLPSSTVSNLITLMDAGSNQVDAVAAEQEPADATTFGYGVTAGGSGVIGLTGGLAGTGDLSAGYFYDGNRESFVQGAAYEYGVQAHPPLGVDPAVTVSEPAAQNPPVTFGASAGLGIGGFITNAGSPEQLRGPFFTRQLNTPYFSAQYSSDQSGTRVLSVTAGPMVGLGSFWQGTTNTVTSPSMPVVPTLLTPRVP